VRFEVLKTVTLTITAFWHVTPYSLETFTNVLEDAVKMEVTCSSKMSVHFYQRKERHISGDRSLHYESRSSVGEASQM
jgi:hypothetical protein